MTVRWPIWLALAVFGLIAVTEVRAEASCTYKRYRWRSLPNNGSAPTNEVGCPFCSPGCQDQGWNQTGTSPTACSSVVMVLQDTYDCATDQQVASGALPVAPDHYCPCDPEFRNQLGATIRTQGDDTVVPGASYQCDTCTQGESGEPELCDGKNGSNLAPVDPGCGHDEHSCSRSGDSDGAPVRFSSGRVETKPLTLFSVPTPEGISFGYTLQWGSHVMRTQAQARQVPLPSPQAPITDTVPTIHHHEEATHFFGRGWTDDFSDRLFISMHDKSDSIITWQSSQGTVTFSSSTNWKSWSGKFELVNRCPLPSSCPNFVPPDGLGRWVIRSTDTNAPRRMWSFEELTYTSYGGGSFTLGRLKRKALLTSNLSNLTGRYGYTLSWSSAGTLNSVVDTLGRELDFDYYSTSPISGATLTTTLTAVKYRPAPGATAIVVVDLTMDPGNALLERVSRPGVGGYTRFLYWRNSNCAHCGSMITDMITAKDAVSTPAPFAPVLSSEIALEHNDYDTVNAAGIDPKNPLGVHSKYPGREYAYAWTATATTQYDLHQDGGACGTGCAAGYACRAADGHCYVANVIQHDPNTRLNTTWGNVSGTGPGTGSRTYSAVGAPRRAMDSANTKTTTGYDSLGRIRCIVRNDNDDEAFTAPGSPDTSACAGPATAQIIRVDYGTGAGGCSGPTVTKTTPSLLSGTVTDIECLDATTLLSTSTIRTGFTKDINAALLSETHTSTTTYDAFGRPTEQNGPLIDSVALDRTTTTYYAYDAAWPYNVGHVATTTSYIGTSATNTPITTTYAEYDVFGVPHRITSPNGDRVQYTPSADRLTWTIAQIGSTGGTIGTSTVKLNADGTTRSTVDADGICMTYEYMQGTDYVGVPTKIRRSASTSACGTVPINESSGEVEIRTYTAAEPDRLASITRKLNGATQYTYSGFTYDRDRRVTAATSLDSAIPFTFGFTDVVPTSVTAPEGPGPGTWKTVTTADAAGRPATLSRFLDATNKQTYTYSYASTFSPRPTQLSRGYNGASTSVTTFVYDDFGRLLQTVVPESGAPSAPAPTRYEYDVASRMVKKRVGVGTALVRTTAYSYDSLGRTTFVDNDTEHPVNCASAPAGTPIQDEEYKYDSCPAPDAPAGFTCTNALGKLTIARELLQCGTGGQVIKRGRWYNYDTVGRLQTVSYATVTGSTIGAPATMPYTYTAASRMKDYQSPLNKLFGSRYTYGASNGRVTDVLTTADTNIANSITYRAFGPLTTLATTSVLAGHGTLRLAMKYRSDDSISLLDWSFGNSSPIAIVKPTMGYTAAGLLKTRTDAADIRSSRYYGYDALLRMTCEARGDATVQPSSVDCDIRSPRLAGYYTYGTGQAATSPPDVRLTSFVRGDNPMGGTCNSGSNCYLSPSVETSTYTNGSGRVQGISRTGSNLVIGYDALGRRSFEYDSFDATRSRRDYTYLPNGQLGTITGKTPANNSYTYTMRYDERGRPVTITATDTYELFWDDADRLIAALVTFGAARGGFTSARWHYHYLDGTLVAATRELGANVKRFWAATDERGLVYRMTDEQGATYWQARWDATGWRTLIGQPQPEMWVPFGLPGQIVLGPTWVGGSTGVLQTATEAYATGTGGDWVRPPIALNQWRAYDPLMGSFLQSDSGDQTARLNPEGYIYGRNRPGSLVDPMGYESVSLFSLPNIEGCSESQRRKIETVFNELIMTVAKCDKGLCAGAGGGQDLRRLWASMLLRSPIICANYFSFSTLSPNEFVNIDGRFIDRTDGSRARALSNGSKIELPPAGFGPGYAAPKGIHDDGRRCFERTLLHEALHITFHHMEATDYSTGIMRVPEDFTTWTPPPFAEQPLGDTFRDDETEVVEQVAQCVDCPKK